jgi:hypothetical protein
MNEFKRGYQLGNNLLKDKNGNLLADACNILKYFSQLLNVHRFSETASVV